MNNYPNNATTEANDLEPVGMVKVRGGFLRQYAFHGAQDVDPFQQQAALPLNTETNFQSEAQAEKIGSA